MESKFGEILSFAIQKEEEAADFYKELSKRTESPNAKKMFDEFAAEEEKHKEKLSNINEESIVSYSVQSVPDLKISDYLVDVLFKPDTGYQDALIIAMKREEKAHDMYVDMAKKVAGSELEKLLLVLAQEEAKHKLRLEKEYDEYVYTEG